MGQVHQQEHLEVFGVLTYCHSGRNYSHTYRCGLPQPGHIVSILVTLDQPNHRYLRVNRNYFSGPVEAKGEVPSNSLIQRGRADNQEDV